MDPLAASQEGDVLDLDHGDNYDEVSNLFVFEEEEEKVFVALAQAAKAPAPVASSAGDESGTPAILHQPSVQV